jgi:hypothetical protein
MNCVPGHVSESEPQLFDALHCFYWKGFSTIPLIPMEIELRARILSFPCTARRGVARSYELVSEQIEEPGEFGGYEVR